MELVNTGDSGVSIINDRWTNSKHSILKAIEEVSGKGTRAARKPWIDQKTLKLMNEKRKHKNAKDTQGKTQYKRLRNEVQRRCTKARNNWIKEKCKVLKTILKIGKIDAGKNTLGATFESRRGLTSRL